MRCIGELDTAHAEKFCDYLLTLGIHASPQSQDPDASGASAKQDIWVQEEDRLNEATDELSQFTRNPQDTKYAGAAQRAADIRMQARQKNEEIRKLQKHVRSRGPGAQSATLGETYKRHPVTLTLIILCVLATLVTNMGRPSTKIRRDAEGNQIEPFGSQVFRALAFVDYADYLDSNKDPLASIRKGEIWRAFSCFFIHLGVFHLAFNMLWMFNLGRALERLHGPLFFGLLIIGCTIAGSMTQALMPAALGGSPFGFGASGGVYGLFGFLWVRPYFQPDYPYRMPTDTVALMLIWLFVCMTGLFGPIANGAHVGGLIAGILAAQLTASRR